jgi:hypothetical protein
MSLILVFSKKLPRAHTESELDVLGVHRKLVKYVVHSSKSYFYTHKLPKQQSTSFWSQGILGVKVRKQNGAYGKKTSSLILVVLWLVLWLVLKLLWPNVLLELKDTLELSVKYVQKRKPRANFVKTRISTSQGAKCSWIAVLKQV